MNPDANMQDALLAFLGCRNGIKDFQFFVGRKELQIHLRACEVGTGSAWLHGPRRIGKTALAQKIARQAQERGTQVLWADASDKVGDDFQGLLAKTLEKAFQAPSTGGARERFEAVAAATGEQHPLLVVFDEFDHFAVNLQLDEQAFLRRLTSQYPRVAYLFVTRLDPAVLVEELSDERSRLLGICTQLHVKPFDRGELREFCQKVQAALGTPIDGLREEIWQRAGGHTLSVVELTKAVAVSLLAESPSPLSEIFERNRVVVLRQLASHWRDLRLGTRALLLAAGDHEPTEAERQDAEMDGYLADGKPNRPRWLCEEGARQGLVPDDPTPETGSLRRFATVERLHGLVYAINSALRYQHRPSAFKATDETLRYFVLSRTDATEEGLRWAVDHLHKILVEGARQPKPEKDGQKPWLMPIPMAEAYKRSRGYKQLCALRNFFDHNMEVSEGSAVDRYTEIGDIYQELSGVRVPGNKDQWACIRDSLIASILKALEELKGLSTVAPGSACSRPRVSA